MTKSSSGYPNGIFFITIAVSIRSVCGSLESLKSCIVSYISYVGKTSGIGGRRGIDGVAPIVVARFGA